MLMIRVDENLYFANSQYLKDVICQRLQSSQDIRHVVLVGNAINHINLNGFETLQHLLDDLLPERSFSRPVPVRHYVPLATADTTGADDE